MSGVKSDFVLSALLLLSLGRFLKSIFHGTSFTFTYLYRNSSSKLVPDGLRKNSGNSGEDLCRNVCCCSRRCCARVLRDQFRQLSHCLFVDSFARGNVVFLLSADKDKWTEKSKHVTGLFACLLPGLAATVIAVLCPGLLSNLLLHSSSSSTTNEIVLPNRFSQIGSNVDGRSWLLLPLAMEVAQW